MSQRGPAASLKALGHPINQSAITRIERGERKVTLGEVVALAVALDVAPIYLFLPIDEDRVSLTPTKEVNAAVARQWAAGIRPLDPANTRSYSHQAPSWEEMQVQREEDPQARIAELELSKQEADGSRPPIRGDE